MKVIIDTNVLVSAIIKDRDPKYVIMFIVNNTEYEWIVSPEIMAEYKEVLSRKKFGLTSNILQKWFDILDSSTTIIEVDSINNFPRDPKDSKLINCARLCDADFLITGDRDFEEAPKLPNTKILSVSLFKELISG